MKRRGSRIRFVCLDWGGTLMSEDGPAEISMAYWPEVKPIDGARELLAALAPARTLYIATNATVSRRPEIEMALSRAGLRDFISDVFCFTEIQAKKSTAAFWNVVTERLRCAADEIAILGDSLEEDVLGPAGQGVFAVWFNPSGRNVPQGVISVTSLLDFVRLIED